MTSAEHDPESSRWLEELRASEPVRNAALARLHAMLLRIARGEANRRRGSLPDDVLGDVEDLCNQAANDALVAILRKLDGFRGASRFTTWAYKFAILEISVRLRRRAWSSRRVDFDAAAWERLADRTGDIRQSLREEAMLAVVRKSIEETLTEYQRRVFLAVVVEGVPIDVVAERMGSSRGSLYKSVHDARRKLRDSLIAAGYLEDR